MLEFRAVCDPNYKGTLYVDTVTAEARPGQAVRVIRGPFAGLEGKLTQYKKSYYVVVTLAYYRRHAAHSKVVLRKNQLIITLRSSGRHLVVGQLMSGL